MVQTLHASDFLGALPDYFSLVGCGLLLGLFVWLVALTVNTCIRLFKA